MYPAPLRIKLETYVFEMQMYSSCKVFMQRKCYPRWDNDRRSADSSRSAWDCFAIGPTPLGTIDSAAANEIACNKE